MPLDEVLLKIRENLPKMAYPKEASVSLGIVLPILRALGCPIADR